MGTGYIAGIYGLKLSTSINYGFIIKSSLVFTIILAFTFLKEKINRNKIQIMMMFILGAYLITSGGKIIIPKSGDLLTLLVAFCFSSALIIQKPLTKKISPDIIGWGRIFFALPILFVSVIAFRVDASQIVSPTYMIIVGMLGSILAISINKTISVSSASYLTMMSMITPVLVIILSLLFLKEPVSIPQIIGGLIIVVSGVLVHKSKI